MDEAKQKLSVADVLAQQRNDAMNLLAMKVVECEELRAQLAAVKVELDALKPAVKTGKKPV